jgi:hypothetical protein
MYLGEVVVQSHRKPVAGVSIGAFSYQDLTDAQARRLGVQNSQTLTRTFETHPPRILVMTPFDVASLRRAGWFSNTSIGTTRLDDELAHYRKVCTSSVVRNVHQNLEVKVEVYARR